MTITATPWGTAFCARSPCGWIKRCVNPISSRAWAADEFAVLAPDTGERDAARIALALLEALMDPVTVDDLNLQLSASVGIALSPRDGQTPHELLHGADRAMYAAKRRGSGYEWYRGED